LFGLIFTLSFTLTKQSYAFDIMAIFKSADRRDYEAILNNDPQKAVQLFKNKDWQAAANFRADNFDKAIEMYAAQNTEEGFYNLGNALAQKQELEQAIEAYKKALELNPNHEDAKYNKELIEEFLENQDKDKDKQGDNQDKEQKQNQNQDNQNQGNNQNQGSSGGQDKQDENNQQQQSSQPQGGGKQQNQSQNNQNEQQSQNQEDNQQKDEQPQEGQGDNSSQNQDTKNSEDSQKNKQAMDAIPDDPAYYLRAKIRQLYFKERYKNEDN
jgi:Ca-activated chloride channel family protein